VVYPKLTEPSIDVRYEPFREVVIRECIYFPRIEELVRFADIAAGGRPTGLNWAEGVAFIYYPIPLATELAARELIVDARVYWAFVSYALMPEYSPVVETKEKIILPVINVSSSPFFRQVARWLRRKAEEET